jgi:predicted dehydrogenase
MFAQAGVEAVCICTPHPAHRDPALMAARAGVHVLVEKPMAASLADCDAMIAAARESGVQLGVISQRRFYEPVKRLKAAIEAGKIGAPVLGTVLMLSWRDEAYYRSDPWRGRLDTEGGGVLVNRHTLVTEFAESGAGDEVIMSIAGLRPDDPDFDFGRHITAIAN